MNDSEARQIVGRLTSCFPAARLGADNVAAYIAWIRKWDWDIAEAAVVSVVGVMKRWPTLADFDEACRDILSQRRLRAELETSHQWAPLTTEERASGKLRVAEMVGTLKKAHEMPFTGNRRRVAPELDRKDLV